MVRHHLIVPLFVEWWFVGEFFPLHKPSASAEDIAGFYHHDVVSIRLGMVLVMWGAATFIPFTSTIADTWSGSRAATGH